MSMLQIRYHTQFNGRATLLFAGLHADMETLRSCLSEWDGQDTDLVKQLKAQAEVYQFSVSRLILTQDRLKSAFFLNGDQGVWFISSLYKDTYTSALDELLESDLPGHRFLSYAGPGHVQIMVSKDEQPLSFRGSPIDHFINSNESIAFTIESLAALRRHVDKYSELGIIPCVGVNVDKYRQLAVILAGNSIESHNAMRPPAIPDQIEGVSFYWQTNELDLIRKAYYIDADDRCHLVPFPGSRPI